MQARIVFTFMAPDKPGLLEQMAAVVADHSGSWLESRLAKLGGQFTGIVLVAIEQEHRHAAEKDLLALNKDDFRITVLGEDDGATTVNTDTRTIDVLGNDRPGIVHELSRTLLKHSINVEELHTELRSAPMSGDELFAAEVEISVPAEIDAEQFQQELESVAEELDLDIQLQ